MKNTGNAELDLYDEANSCMYELEVLANQIGKKYWVKTGSHLDDVTLLALAVSYKLKQMEKSQDEK